MLPLMAWGQGLNPKVPAFVKLFQAGANDEGCWGHDHMAMQLDACVACLKAAHPDFDFVCLFDHNGGALEKVTWQVGRSQGELWVWWCSAGQARWCHS
jgi:hypothetical protein